MRPKNPGEHEISLKRHMTVKIAKIVSRQSTVSWSCQVKKKNKNKNKTNQTSKQNKQTNKQKNPISAAPELAVLFTQICVMRKNYDFFFPKQCDCTLILQSDK